MTGHRTFIVQFRQSHQRQCVDTIATHVQGDSRRRSGVLHPPRANQTSLLLPPIPLPSFSPPSLPLPDPSTSPPSYFPYLPLHSLPLEAGCLKWRERLKMRDVKIRHQNVRHENARHENSGKENAGQTRTKLAYCLIATADDHQATRICLYT